MTASEEAAKRLEEALHGGRPISKLAVKIATRVTIRKFNGDDQSGEPVETVVIEDPEFQAIHQKGLKDATSD